MALPIEIVEKYPSWALEHKDVELVQSIITFFVNNSDQAFKMNDILADLSTTDNPSQEECKISQIVTTYKQYGFLTKKGPYYASTEDLLEDKTKILDLLDEFKSDLEKH